MAKKGPQGGRKDSLKPAGGGKIERGRSSVPKKGTERVLVQKRGKGSRISHAEVTARTLAKSPRGATILAAKEALSRKLPGKMHTKYYEMVKKMDAKTRAAYRTTMAGLKASVIRGRSRILNKPKGKEIGKQRILSLREEQARRIAAYTEKCGPKSYILKYPPNHEYTIGCGEVFLCANMLKIEKTDGTIIIAKRMVTPSGRHKGRLAFCSINTPHEYVATYSGDKVTILDNQERVNVDNPKAVAAHIKILDQEEATRKAHAADFAKTEEFYSSTNYTPWVNPYAGGGSMDLKVKIPKTKPSEIPGDDVLREFFNPRFLRKLSKVQKTNIGIIIQEFRNAGLTNPNLIAAAIANAYKESSFRHTLMSRCKIRSQRRGSNEIGWYDSKGILRERSVGLFQFNVPASVPMKKGIPREEIRRRRDKFEAEMKDARKNCKKVIRRVKSRRGRQLRAAADAGAGVYELTRLFTIYIEICRDRYNVGKKRGRYAVSRMFKNVERPRENAIAEWTRTPDRIGRYAKHPNVRTRLRSGQEKWVFASSQGTLMEMGRGLLSPKTGIVAIGAYNAKNFFSYFLRYTWPRIKHFKLPKKIIIAGLYLNGAGSWSPQRALQYHMKIVNFFKSKGVDVKIATCQPYPRYQERINAFNKLLRTKGLTEDSIDLAKTVAPNGVCQRGTLADGLHLSYRSRKQFARNLDNA